jgi:hypothetical protein
MGTSAGLVDDRRAPGELADDGPPAGLLDGLVPVAFAFRHRRVRLLDLRGADCREQNFRATAERWVAEHPDLTPVEMTWSAYLAAARETRCRPLGGIIFNVARCGSTLLANMLGVLPGSVVLKESTTVAMLIRRQQTAPTVAERQELAELLTVSLPLFGRLAPAPRGRQSAELLTARVFVKPHSSLTAYAGWVLDLLPETPAIFLYRDPSDVVASMLAKPPYGGLYDLPREEVTPGFPSLAGAPADLSPAGFHAHLWRSPVEAALALPPDRLLYFNYAELVTDPVAAIGRITRHLGIEPSPETVAQMAGVMGVYAKDAGGQQFDATGTHRRPPLRADQRADVESVVGDLYQKLAARRKAQTDVYTHTALGSPNCCVRDTSR